MKVQEMLREENFQLKNQITDLKNAFDLNRDILKILSSYNHAADPQLNLLMQIITRLTTVNNQAMLNNIELIHQKNVLKKQNLRLNLQYNRLEEKLDKQIDLNRISNQPNESKILIQQNINALNRQLMAANEERIIKEQEIEYWKQKFNNLQQMKGENNTNRHKEEEPYDKRTIKRRYTTNESFTLYLKNRELQKQNRRLKQLVQQLENRLIIFIKAYNLQQELIIDSENKRESRIVNSFQSEKEEIRLLKYALNDIQVQRKEDQYILTITQRFKPKDINSISSKETRSSSWPKNKAKNDTMEVPIEENRTSKMEERRYLDQ